MPPAAGCLSLSQHPTDRTGFVTVGGFGKAVVERINSDGGGNWNGKTKQDLCTFRMRISVE